MSASSSTTKLDDVHPQHHQQQQQAPSSIVKFKVQSSLPVSTSSSEKPAKSADHHHHRRRHPPPLSSDVPPQWNSLPLVALGNIYSYLDVSHRLKASSTCHSWRNVLFTSTLFPCRNFRVNLCAHKFTIPPAKVNHHHSGANSNDNNNNSNNTESKQAYGFSVFTLRNRNQPYGGNGSSPAKRRFKQGQKSFNNEHLKAFLQKCAPLLTGLKIFFDPNSTLNVIDLTEIIKFFSENEVPIYNLSAAGLCTFANCRNLSSLVLVPVTPLLRSSRGFTYLYSDLSEAIRFLLSKCKKLEELCLGDLDHLTSNVDLFLEELSKSKVEQSITRLHISSIKSDVFQYAQPLLLSPAAFGKFTSLVSLSIDFDCLNASAIKELERLSQLKHLQINVHRYNHHRGATIDACSWASLHRALPKLSATVNLLHIEPESFDFIIESLIASDLPIRHFRSYYLELKEGQAQEQMKNLLEKLYLRQGKHLETAVFVDHLYQSKKFQEFTVLQNPWVMFAWRCHVLHSLTIIGLSFVFVNHIIITLVKSTCTKHQLPSLQATILTTLTSWQSLDFGNEHYTTFTFPAAASRNQSKYLTAPVKLPAKNSCAT